MQAHNKERKVFGETNLIWNTEISNYAQEWAEYLANRDQGLTHRQKSGYGENIAQHYSNNPAYGVDLWNEEKKDFVYQPIGNNWAKTGHYGLKVLQAPYISFVIIIPLEIIWGKNHTNYLEYFYLFLCKLIFRSLNNKIFISKEIYSKNVKHEKKA